MPAVDGIRINGNTITLTDSRDRTVSITVPRNQRATIRIRSSERPDGATFAVRTALAASLALAEVLGTLVERAQEVGRSTLSEQERSFADAARIATGARLGEVAPEEKRTFDQVGARDVDLVAGNDLDDVAALRRRRDRLPLTALSPQRQALLREGIDRAITEKIAAVEGVVNAVDGVVRGILGVGYGTKDLDAWITDQIESGGDDVRDLLEAVRAEFVNEGSSNFPYAKEIAALIEGFRGYRSARDALTEAGRRAPDSDHQTLRDEVAKRGAEIGILLTPLGEPRAKAAARLREANLPPLAEPKPEPEPEPEPEPKPAKAPTPAPEPKPEVEKPFSTNDARLEITKLKRERKGLVSPGAARMMREMYAYLLRGQQFKGTAGAVAGRLRERIEQTGVDVSGVTPKAGDPKSVLAKGLDVAWVGRLVKRLGGDVKEVLPEDRKRTTYVERKAGDRKTTTRKLLDDDDATRVRNLIYDKILERMGQIDARIGVLGDFIVWDGSSEDVRGRNPLAPPEYEGQQELPAPPPGPMIESWAEDAFGLPRGTFPPDATDKEINDILVKRFGTRLQEAGKVMMRAGASVQKLF